MFRLILLVLAGAGLLISLWPNAGSLYDLTGEESLEGQLRGVVHWLNTAVRPQPELAPYAVTESSAVSPFGMNTFLEQEVLPEVREQSLQMIHDAGFDYIRQQFPWEDIEIHAKGDFIDRRNDPEGVDAWSKYDNIVALAEQYEINIIARLDNPPSWSRGQPDEVIGSHAPPDNFDDYGDFVAAVAERYRGRIRYYQLWNEPNIYPEWGEQPVNPEAFTELLCTGYRRIKAVDPGAVVLAGALSPTVALDYRDLNNLVFLQRMYAAGAGECFDILSVQGYGLWSGPTDQRLRPTVINYPQHLFVRDLMVQHGDAEKPIWISEMGWNTAPEGIPAVYGRVTAEQQGRYGVEAYRRAQEEWPWVEVINYWFFKRAADYERDQPFYYFRLLEPDFTPQPAFDRLAGYAASAPPADTQPAYIYTWQRARPVLFKISGGLLFFSLLMLLAPANARTAARAAVGFRDARDDEVDVVRASAAGSGDASDD